MKNNTSKTTKTKIFEKAFMNAITSAIQNYIQKYFSKKKPKILGLNSKTVSQHYSVSRVEYGKKLNSAVPDLLLLLLLLWLLVITVPGSRIASIVHVRVLGNLCVPIAIGGRCISIVAATTIPLAWICLRLKNPS